MTAQQINIESILTDIDDTAQSDSKEILDKINLTLEKIDELIIREMRAANTGLIDILSSGVYDTPLLSKIESCYIANTGLSPVGSTGGKRNTQIIANAYMGLYIIGSLRGDDKTLLVRYILHMFETRERVVRTDWFPELYQAVFLPKCSDIIRRYHSRLSNQAQPGDYITGAGIRVAEGMTLLVTFFRTVIFKSPLAPKYILQDLESHMPRVEYFTTKSGLKNDMEQQIDQRCAELAERILAV